jgi:hypothetical protein
MAKMMMMATHGKDEGLRCEMCHVQQCAGMSGKGWVRQGATWYHGLRIQTWRERWVGGATKTKKRHHMHITSNREDW